MVKKAAALLLVCIGMGACVSCNALFSSNNRFVYAAIPGVNEIVAYREDPNAGALTQLAGSPISSGQTVQALAMHPSGKFLYAAIAAVNEIWVYSIGSNGLLTQTNIANTGTVPTVMAIDSAGAYLYVGNSGTNDISAFSIDSSSGALTAVAQLSGATAPIGLSPLNLQVAPSGDVLYVTGEGTTVGYIEAFPLSSGQLGALITGKAFTTGNNPYGLAINPSGTFLYTANELDNSISEFAINSDGSLTALQNSPVFESYSAPASLLISKSGAYLYVANQGASGTKSSYNVAAFDISSAGGLSTLDGSPFGTGAEPSILAADPSGKYLFVGNQSSPAIQSFAVDTGDGVLTSVDTYAITQGTPTSIVVTPQ
jgi:6-phosphogluconolactonase (cycloisomerase 2 family)